MDQLQSNQKNSHVRLRRVLAVASGGGHWVQLRRLRPALDRHRVVYVTTNAEYAHDVAPLPLHTVNDAARDSKIKLIAMAFRMALIMLRVRPHVVVSTGAAPGYVALRLGRMIGARTIWIDSIANADEVSLAGRLAQPYADLWLTQWPHLAAAGGAQYQGSVL